MWRSTCQGCVVTHSVCLVGIWTRTIKVWDRINTLRCRPFKPLSTHIDWNCNITMTSSGFFVLSHEEAHASCLLPRMPCFLCVHWQYPTSLGYIQCADILPIKVTEYPSSGTKFGRTHKTTMPFWGQCALWDEGVQAMRVLPPVPHASWICGQGQSNMKPSQYIDIEMLSNQAIEYPSCETRFGRTYRTTMPSSGWCVLWHGEVYAMVVLSCWVNLGQQDIPCDFTESLPLYVWLTRLMSAQYSGWYNKSSARGR